MTKEELNKYYNLKKEINYLENRIKEINEKYISASMINCERFEKNLSNPLEKRLILIEEYENKLHAKKIALLDELIKIEDYISTIDDIDTRLIFRYRYIEQNSWEQIAMLMHMGIATVFRKHKKQIDTLFYYK